LSIEEGLYLKDTSNEILKSSQKVDEGEIISQEAFGKGLVGEETDVEVIVSVT